MTRTPAIPQADPQDAGTGIMPAPSEQQSPTASAPQAVAGHSVDNDIEQGLLNTWGAEAEAEPDKLTGLMAEKLANDPNKLEFLLDLFGKRHIGDRDQARLCLLCALSIRVANAREGTNVVISGERSAGKTDFVNTISRLIPQELGGKKAVISGEQSDKWITRAVEGKVIGSQCVMIFDDTYKSEASTLWQKQLTTWDTIHSYQALEARGKGYMPKSYLLPQQTVRIYVNVDAVRDEQENSRILNLHLTNSPEREYAIRERIRTSWADKEAEEEIETEFTVVQRMWGLLEPNVKVTIPESIRITGGEGESRWYQRIYTLIASQAAMRAGPRQKEITATLEDAEAVIRPVNAYLRGEMGGGAEAMDANPLKLLNSLLARGTDFDGSVTDLTKHISINDYSLVHRGIYGRKKSNGSFSQGLIHLGYVTDEELTETETLQSGGYSGDIPTKRRTKRERIIHFDYAAAQRKRKGVIFVVSPSI